VASLWSLTRALNVDFGGLLDASGDAERNIRDIQRAGQTPVIAGTGRGCLIRILSRPEDVGQTEIYELLFQPDGLLDSAPHRPGCTEYLTVLEGRLSLQSGGEAAELATGDTIRYRADVDHRIAAPDTARAILVVKDA
jgi:mannose-6-phosphate isomerase-like protein (cupin superfamily)